MGLVFLFSQFSTAHGGGNKKGVFTKVMGLTIDPMVALIKSCPENKQHDPIDDC